MRLDLVSIRADWRGLSWICCEIRYRHSQMRLNYATDGLGAKLPVSMHAIDLPRWPPKGKRRKLDQLWLEVLESRGLGAVVAEAATQPPGELWKATDEFNQRLFWECHETLEGIWLKTEYPIRLFYHAIIKVAVGFHHMARHNRHGARVKLADGIRLLRLFQPGFYGVRTDELSRESSAFLVRLENAGPVDWKMLDALTLPRIGMVDAAPEEGPLSED